MKTTTDDDILNTCIGQEFKSVFNQRSICERKKTLLIKSATMVEVRIPVVCSYSRSFKGEGRKASLECVS